MSSRRRSAALGPVLALCLMVAACGDDDAETPTSTIGATTTSIPGTTGAPTTPTTSTTTTSTAPASTTTSTTTAPLFDGDTSPKSGEAQGVPSGLLTDVRFAPRDGFTRIVFDFQGTTGIPAYEIQYAPGPFANMGEVVVPVAGTAFISVRMHPAIRADLGVDPYVLTYTGPERIPVGTSSVTEIVFLDDFEANMIWIIGVGSPKSFRVGTLTNPPRIFVDVAD